MNEFFAVSPVIFAHVLPGDAGAIEGFLHPLLGLEHLIAMVAVGLLSAQIGKRAIWSVPLAFIVAMAIGGVIGYYGGATPLIDIGIAVSLILLGGALALQRRIAELVALIVVAIFALFHGYAHGEAIPADQDLLFLGAYVLGFVMSTAGLHIIGALIGFIALRSPRGTLILRVSGVLIALFGLAFMAGLI